jgi:hypothetical protein
MELIVAEQGMFQMLFGQIALQLEITLGGEMMMVQVQHGHLQMVLIHQHLLMVSFSARFHSFNASAASIG